MTPSADPANLALPAVPTAERLLHDGELIILAVKPSPWSILLNSGPVLILSGLVAAAGWFGRNTLAAVLPGQAVALACAAAALLRLLVAGLQWTGRLYLLTNLRVMRIRGVLRADVVQCPLRRILAVAVAAGRTERFLGVGNLCFRTDRTSAAPPSGAAPGGLHEAPDISWTQIARPAEVQRMVEDAIGRAR